MRNTGWGDSLESLLDSLLQKRDSAQKKNQNPIIDHNRIWYLFCIQFSIRMSVSICVLFCSFGFLLCACLVRPSGIIMQEEEEEEEDEGGEGCAIHRHLFLEP